MALSSRATPAWGSALPGAPTTPTSGTTPASSLPRSSLGGQPRRTGGSGTAPWGEGLRWALLGVVPSSRLIRPAFDERVAFVVILGLGAFKEGEGGNFRGGCWACRASRLSKTAEVGGRGPLSAHGGGSSGRRGRGLPALPWASGGPRWKQQGAGLCLAPAELRAGHKRRWVRKRALRLPGGRGQVGLPPPGPAPAPLKAPPACLPAAG